ncbi:MAG TPA: gliding motility-associated C-terminal domain-containing protein [Chitinophagales bacterium]|nr:gliding motility-associated C-terminal domain-containing protein [Chitinophagales bacterium]
MKKTPAALLICNLVVLCVSAQQMHVKKHNFTTFTANQPKVDSRELEMISDAKDKRHPEYGILPFNAPCTDCAEEIGKRTETSRIFVDTVNGSHTYSQKSYLPLHYKKSEGDVWHTIDYRLKPNPSLPGVYSANDQLVPATCNLNRKTTSLNVGGFVFEFNKDITMYFYEENTAYTKREKGNYDNHTIGNEGLYVKGMWPGINMEQIFRDGNIETNYVIPAPLRLPINKGWMVIEDHFTLPPGTTIEEEKKGERDRYGFYSGNYIIKDFYGNTLFMYERPVFFDATAVGQHGGYELLQNGNDCVLKMMVPVEWLNRKENTYPIYIDPTVQGSTIYGVFRSSNSTLFRAYAFTSRLIAPGYCEDSMDVIVPGKSTLKDTYLNVEYELTYDNTCGNPPLPSPYCTFSQVKQELICKECATGSGVFGCNPAAAPYTGTCTTDDSLVPGAQALHINNFNPNFLGCFQPQCPDYDIHFYLRNTDSICGDACGYLCARGNMWQVIVTACTVEGTVTPDSAQVCAGQAFTITAHPDCGVPPYHFLWSTDGGNTYPDTIYGNPNYIVHPTADMYVKCIIYDSCNSFYVPNISKLTVVPSPPANAGADKYICEGGRVTIGGSPTTTGASVQWAGENATQTGWLSNVQSPNPQVTVPAGTVDTLTYVVTATSNTCFKTDTMNIYSLANPVVTVDTSGSTHFCSSETVTISAVGNFSSYLWNNGSTSPSVTVSQPGSYFVIVADQNNCKDTSSPVVVTNIAVPAVHVYPDTLIHLGDSVMLYTDLNLGLASIDSFTWYPSAYISCTTCNNPYALPQADQYFGLTVYTGGCVISDSALIRVILPNNFFIPNVFTPNNDGNNDQFYILSQSGVKVVYFEVFDRWGEKVHEGAFPWDGTYKGKPAPAGVYVYLFKLGLYGDENAIMRKGTVTLIR